MPAFFEPRLEMLPPSQRRLWDELGAVPAVFTLYGGTAIALHLAHRTSIDFDFFGEKTFDPDRLLADLPFLSSATPLQKNADTLTCRIERDGDSVLVSFFAVPQLGRVEPPVVARDNGLRVASLLDLAGAKAAVVQKRAEAKDYLDLDALITKGEVDLPAALAAGSGSARASRGSRPSAPARAFATEARRRARAMKKLPLTPELRKVARRVVWFEPPEQALGNVPRLVAYAMTYGAHEDMQELRRHLSDDDLREALDQAPPGIFDPRSWAYWNLMLDRYPAPPLPQRRLLR